ncbi:unnamed protein product [Trichogramma brassicae]|uniref:Endonuclease/exonuclease/phosphatase domain-containing protein n=1 Tax=Trichogramma brassicae TaxID=86971 RepID=A0A6H5I8J1_9HYME|nr:unnamed protein product [Trichogramma brassicae]
MESITITVGNCHIKSAPHIRYLGLHIDARLRFDVHLAKASEKARSVAGALGSIMPRTGGPRCSRRKLYAGVVDSVLLYGAPIWSSATELRAYLRQAESIHRRACLRIISGRPHLSYEATYVLASIPPLALLADERARLFHRSRDDAGRGDERQETLRRWQVQWDQSTKGRWTHRLVPDIKEWVERRHGEMSYHLTQLLSGHGYFRHHSQRYDNNASARCPCSTRLIITKNLHFHATGRKLSHTVQANVSTRVQGSQHLGQMKLTFDDDESPRSPTISDLTSQTEPRAQVSQTNRENEENQPSTPKDGCLSSASHLILTASLTNQILLDFVGDLLYRERLHLLALTETWLNPLFGDNLFMIPNYTLIRNDRGLRSSDDLGYMRGGGVAFYLHNSLNFAVLESPSVPDLDEAEFMMLDVSTAAESVCQHVLVVVLYRQPDGPAGLALTLFFSVLDNYRHSFKNIIIMGDFNVDMNRCDNFSRHLSTLIHERGLYLVPSPNTHFTYRPSSTLIDLTIIDESSKLLRYSVGDVPIAGGHCVTVLGYRLPSRPVNYREVTYRDFRNCDVAVLRDLVSADMTDLFSSERELDITALVSAFNECVVRCLDRCAPFVTRPFRRPPAPWFTPELRRSCRERDRLYRLARRLGSSRMLQEYKIRRRAIKALIFEARRAYLAVAVEAAPDQA